MMFRPTQSGGRVASGDTPFGSFRVEWDAEGNLIRESCEIKTLFVPKPKPDKCPRCPTGIMQGGCKRRCNACGFSVGCGE